MNIMKPIILIYATDCWHSFASREIIGIATTENQRDRLIRQYLREGESVSRKEIADAIDEIHRMGQTQCLAEKYDIEIDTETVKKNTLL